MRFHQWRHEGVKQDGTFEGIQGTQPPKGHVHTHARVFYSIEEKWVSVSEARTEAGVIRGVTFGFSSEEGLISAMDKIGEGLIGVDEAIRRLATETVS